MLLPKSLSSGFFLSMKESVIFSLGGSLIVPDQIDADFLGQFKTMIEDRLEAFEQFVIVAGGGKTARRYQDAARAINGPEDEDLDWLGIHSSRLNGHLLRTMFKKHADPEMITTPERMTPREAKILIGAGYRPGNSTDYVATLFAKAYGIKTVVNLSNISHVYDKDPNEHKDAKPLKNMSWSELQALVGTEWTPGANAPFDPIATKLASELGLRVVVMKGGDLENLGNFLDGKDYEGTEIA
jgi:uridylate kinase